MLRCSTLRSQTFSVCFEWRHTDAAFGKFGIPGRQLPVLRDGGDLVLTKEGCAPGNGVIDGHEDVTAKLPITNIGPGATQDLSVTLEASGGVAFPSGAVTVPSIARVNRLCGIFIQCQR